MGYNSGITTMGGRAGGGARGGGGRAAAEANYQKQMASLQSQYNEARKTYNRIKKELGGSNKYVSVGYHAGLAMNKMGLKTPSQIKDQMHALQQQHISDSFGF